MRRRSTEGDRFRSADFGSRTGGCCSILRGKPKARPELSPGLPEFGRRPSIAVRSAAATTSRPPVRDSGPPYAARPPPHHRVPMTRSRSPRSTSSDNSASRPHPYGRAVRGARIGVVVPSACCTERSVLCLGWPCVSGDHQRVCRSARSTARGSRYIPHGDDGGARATAKRAQGGCNGIPCGNGSAQHGTAVLA